MTGETSTLYCRVHILLRLIVGVDFNVTGHFLPPPTRCSLARVQFVLLLSYLVSEPVVCFEMVPCLDRSVDQGFP
jgi:hypothetical protein